jgi:hypothetical protein
MSPIRTRRCATTPTPPGRAEPVVGGTERPNGGAVARDTAGDEPDPHAALRHHADVAGPG